MAINFQGLPYTPRVGLLQQFVKNPATKKSTLGLSVTIRRVYLQESDGSLGTSGMIGTVYRAVVFMEDLATGLNLKRKDKITVNGEEYEIDQYQRRDYNAIISPHWRLTLKRMND